MYKLVVAVFGVVVAIQLVDGQYQQEQYTTPVPILKQIDRHNDDGSYTYGYEAADKSFKIETKYANGEVYGKYGYVDDQGKVREIEYGATKRGFEPAGSDINVPPPTLTNSQPYPLGPNEIDDGQYREDPSVYYKDQKFNRPVASSQFSLNNYQQPQRAYQPAYAPPAPAPVQPHYNQYSRPAPAPALQYQPAPYYAPQQQQPQPQYHQRYQQPQTGYNAYNAVPNHHHPALKNLDLNSGSYSIDYTGRK